MKLQKKNLELTRKFRRCQEDLLLEDEDYSDCSRVEREYNKKYENALQNLNYVSSYPDYFGQEAYDHYYNEVHYLLNPEFNPREESSSGILYDEQWGNANVLPREDEESHGTHVAGIIAGKKLRKLHRREPLR